MFYLLSIKDTDKKFARSDFKKIQLFAIITHVSNDFGGGE